MATADRTRTNDLDGESWRLFIATFLVESQANAPRRFNGRPVVSDADCRALYRWLKEGVAPTIWSADRFLTAFGLHLDFFFTWCEATGRPAWRLGHGPTWHEEEVDAEAIAEWEEGAL